MRSAIWHSSVGKGRGIQAEFSKMAAIMGEEIEETGDFVVNEKDKVVKPDRGWCEEG